MSYLSVREVAGRLGISEYTICEYLKSGKLRGSKVGNKLWRISEENLQEFMKNGEVAICEDPGVGE